MLSYITRYVCSRLWMAWYRISMLPTRMSWSDSSARFLGWAREFWRGWRNFAETLLRSLLHWWAYCFCICRSHRRGTWYWLRLRIFGILVSLSHSLNAYPCTNKCRWGCEALHNETLRETYTRFRRSRKDRRCEEWKQWYGGYCCLSMTLIRFWGWIR